MTEPMQPGKSSVPVCTVEDCGRPRHAKGLCERHYRRLVRTGNPLTTRTPGPKRSAERTFIDGLFVDWSQRTRDKYRAAVHQALRWNLDYMAVINTIKRPNGGFSVTKFADRVQSMSAVKFIEWHDHDGEGPEW